MEKGDNPSIKMFNISPKTCSKLVQEKRSTVINIPVLVSEMTPRVVLGLMASIAAIHREMTVSL